MAGKDLGCKILLDIDEVFPDVLNVCLFKGKEVIKPEALSQAQERSQFHAGKRYHEQIRDVSKFWNKCDIRIAFFGIENENKATKEMPLRIMSYDGGAYRAQLKRNVSKKKKSKTSIYPVVSLVLNFNIKKKWSTPKNLKGVLEIPEELQEYVNDYRIHVIDIPFLEREVIDSFKSDFWFVADYFWQIRNNKDYIPSEKEMTYVYEILQMLSAMTGDSRIENVYNEVDRREGGGKRMCEYVDKLEARGEIRGEARGAARERESGIRVLVESYTEDGLSDDVIIDKLVRKYDLTSKQAKDKIQQYGRRSA